MAGRACPGLRELIALAPESSCPATLQCGRRGRGGLRGVPAPVQLSRGTQASERRGSLPAPAAACSARLKSSGSRADQSGADLRPSQAGAEELMRRCSRCLPGHDLPRQRFNGNELPKRESTPRTSPLLRSRLNCFQRVQRAAVVATSPPALPAEPVSAAGAAVVMAESPRPGGNARRLRERRPPASVPPAICVFPGTPRRAAQSV